MKNIPEKIYLQVGDLTPDEVSEIDFTDLGEVSWCTDRIYDSDIEFVLSDVVVSEQEPPCTGCGRIILTEEDQCSGCRMADTLLD